MRALRLLLISAGGAAVLALSVMMTRNVQPPWPTLMTLGLIGAGLWTWFRVQWLQERRRQRLARGLCARCGYDLRGNVSGVCPECGQRT